MTRRSRNPRRLVAGSDDWAVVKPAAGRDGADSDHRLHDSQEGCDESPQLIVSVDTLDKAYRSDDLLMLQCIFADARRVVRRGGCLVLTGTVLGEVACTTEADIGLLDEAYAPESSLPRIGN